MTITIDEIKALLEEDRKEIGLQNGFYDRGFVRGIKAIAKKLEDKK